MKKTPGYLSKALDIFCYLIPVYFLVMTFRSVYTDAPAIVISSYFSSGFLIGAMIWYNHTMQKHRDEFVKGMQDILDNQWRIVAAQDKVIESYHNQLLEGKGLLVKTGIDPISQDPCSPKYPKEEDKKG